MNFLRTLTQASNKALLLGILFISLSTFGQTYQRDTISMEPGRTHDVFYSLSTGNETSVIRSNWDIEFSTAVMDVTIRTNGANGVKLYTYPNAGLDGWNNMDTTGLHTWPEMYNSDTDWENGAFNKNTSGGLDFGWGVYNTVSHKIVGDSIFVMQLPDMSYKQVWIVLKDPTVAGQNKYTFKYANLDGSDEHEVVVALNDWSTKNFIGYSFADNDFVDREPASKDWDLEFTKYITFYGGQAWYPVTGILQNYNVQVAAFTSVDTTFVDYEISAFDSANISTIGNNWYALQGGMPPTYVLVDSLVYFVSDQESSIWKVVFEYYESNLGEIGFKKMLLEDHASISELDGVTTGNIAIQPNPVKDVAQLLFNADENGTASISVFSMTGAKVFEQGINYSRGLNNHQVNVSGLPEGVYVVMLKAGDTILKNKMVKQ
jgi:hypothetical protein